MTYTKDKTEVIGFRLSKAEANAIRQIAKREKISVADLIREAIVLYKEKGPAVRQDSARPK